MEKRHKHVSPTLDIMAKKIFSLPEVTVAFIRDILDLDVVDAQILELGKCKTGIHIFFYQLK